MYNEEQIQAELETPEGMQAIERAAVRELLAQIERGEGEQVETRRRVGDVIHLLMEDVKQRQELLEQLQKRQNVLSTMQNYMDKMRANYEAKQAAQQVGEG